MIKFAISPKWFYGLDSIFEIISLVVTLMISLYAWKLYKFSKSKNYKYFSLSFLAISISFLFKVLTNFALYKTVFLTKNYGVYQVIYKVVQRVEWLYSASFFLHWIFMLLGLAGVIFLLYRTKDRGLILLTLYFIVITAIASFHVFYVFYITALIFLFMIINKLQQKYNKSKNKNTLKILIAFSFMLIAQIFFIIIQAHPYVYVFAEISQLIGFFTLLFAFIGILRG